MAPTSCLLDPSVATNSVELDNKGNSSSVSSSKNPRGPGQRVQEAAAGPVVQRVSQLPCPSEEQCPDEG